ncbi:MAG: sugar transferase [Crocinitomicaceae bacterium]|nr:sugar transferase [Crocinitomicaceae bacterium]
MRNLKRYIPIEVKISESRLVKKSKIDFVKDAIGNMGLNFVSAQMNLNYVSTRLIYSKDDFNLGKEEERHTGIVSLKKFNNVRHIDSFFENVNTKLTVGGVFVGYIQTNEQRVSNRKRTNKLRIGEIASIFEFIFHRIPPKVKLIKPIYFFLTRGKNRRISKAEICGRMVRSGFTISEINDDIDGFLYFSVIKSGEPIRDDQPSYGLLYKMPRRGQNGKTIGVYKLRTMHPYSEYLQDYVLKTYGYGSNGKPANDFRLTRWGKIFRRYWIDELPQLINVFKGEMKLVGIRPVSDRYYQDIPKHLQKLREKRKPGCIPPYVAFDKNPSKEGVFQAEEMYLRLQKKDSFRTDMKLAFKAIINIVIKRKRSA